APDLAPVFVRAFDDDLRVARLVPDVMLASISGLGALALLLTLVGLYGTVFYSVSQRQMEIGIRVALGAQPWHLIGMVSRHTLALALVGCAAGAGIGQAALPLVSSVLYGIRPVELGV